MTFVKPADEALERYRLQQQVERQKREAPLLEAPVTLHFVVVESGHTVELIVDDDVVIGRRDPTANQAPDIDLSKHGAYQMGVSRRHAVLRLRDQGLELVDLGSRNGTYVNEYRLIAHKPEQVIDGDDIRFGKCLVKVTVNP